MTRNDLRVSTRVIYFACWPVNGISGGQQCVVSTVLWASPFRLSTCSAWGTLWVFLVLIHGHECSLQSFPPYLPQTGKYNMNFIATVCTLFCWKFILLEFHFTLLCWKWILLQQYPLCFAENLLVLHLVLWKILRLSEGHDKGYIVPEHVNCHEMVW